MARVAERSESIALFFEADHARLDAVLERVLEAAMLDDWALARKHFAGFDRGLRRHIRAEEDLLFPAFERAVPGGGPVELMRHEHRTIEGILNEIGAALGDALPIEERVDRLRAVLSGHNLKEEQMLYPACDAELPSPARERLLEESRRLMLERPPREGGRKGGAP
jgi:iron-sulfur cluster repair protein YtfE (RIC family)